jgi:two-component system, cell cycle sensor histidine kinase and response regulator CckA
LYSSTLHRRVKADPVQVEQVLLNLVINARDAMTSGGVIEISATEVEVAEGRHRKTGPLQDGRYLALVVRDEGVGMDPATVARAFEPFFTTKDVGRGTGMGLSTVYGIAKQNGGHVEAESEPGRGSTFRVYFPLAPDGSAEAGDPSEARPEPDGSGTVLLVEDEDAIRELVRELLEQWGFAVLQAAHGGEALDVAAAHVGPIDLVLTDVVMPQMGGPEMVARLEASRPGLRVLFMSGYTNDRVLRQGVREGSTPFLQKPFTSDALRKKIGEAMGASCQ